MTLRRGCRARPGQRPRLDGRRLGESGCEPAPEPPPRQRGARVARLQVRRLPRARRLRVSAGSGEVHVRFRGGARAGTRGGFGSKSPDDSVGVPRPLRLLAGCDGRRFAAPWDDTRGEAYGVPWKMARRYRVLRRTDFSKTSRAALRLAIGFVHEHAGELLILHVIRPTTLVDASTSPATEEAF
jgi:hypothetical protein